MSVAAISFPNELADACADIVQFAHFGGDPPSGLIRVQDWLSNDGWENLVDQWVDEVVLIVAAAPYNDDEMRAQLGLSERAVISDDARASFAKRWLFEAMEENETDVFPSLHICKIERSDGLSSVIACTATTYGQGVITLTWHGAFKDEVNLRSHLEAIGFDFEMDPNHINSDYICRFWSRSST